MSETGSVLLDTSVVIAHLRSRPDAEVERRLKESDQLYLCHVVLGELYYGAYLSGDPVRHIEAMRQFVAATEVLLSDAQVDEQYGRIKAHLRKAGTPIPENDIWIAAVARRHGLPVAARDPHYELVPDLDVQRW